MSEFGMYHGHFRYSCLSLHHQNAVSSDFFLKQRLALQVFFHVIKKHSPFGILEKTFTSTAGWYGKAAAVVEECLYAVRTVVAFGGEFRELDKFGKALVHTRRGWMESGFFPWGSFWGSSKIQMLNVW